MDGNFQAEHMKMQNPENNFPLTDRAGFIVSRVPYESHLKLKIERCQVSTTSSSCFGRQKLTVEQRSMCYDHRAVYNVNKHSKHLESTGIGVTACIHGEFVPNSVVDF